MASRAQMSYLDVLTMQLGATEAEVLRDYGYEVERFGDLTTAEASALIDELKAELEG